MDLIRLENELKKRWEYPYHWGHRQGDDWDKASHFIYTTYSFDNLLYKLRHLDGELINYALNRWYNFWSAKAVEYLFASHSAVKANSNIYDKHVDFWIRNIPFDHKTSVFPKYYGHSYAYAKANKAALITWLYNNQSQQGRKHFANRLYVLLYDTQANEHWQLKAEITLLKTAIDDYLFCFSKEKLIHNNTSVSDLIFVER